MTAFDLGKRAAEQLLNGQARRLPAETPNALKGLEATPSNVTAPWRVGLKKKTPKIAPPMRGSLS